MSQFDKTKIILNSTISFKYKGGRKVRGVILSADEKTCILLLHTDYIGKNVEWYAGEKKEFNINEMKNR